MARNHGHSVNIIVSEHSLGKGVKPADRRVWIKLTSGNIDVKMSLDCFLLLYAD